MTTHPATFTTLSDTDLLAQVTRLAAGERHATVQLIAALMELDARRLYLAQGCASLFAYCVQALRLSEHAAYGRIEAARAARRFPVILEHLADGSLTLTAVGLLASHLTPDNHREVFEAARHKTKREVQHLVARLRPQPPVAATIRKLPVPSAQSAPPAHSAPPAPGTASLVPPPATLPSAPCAPPQGTIDTMPAPVGHPASMMPPPRPSPPPRPAVVVPLAPEIYKVQVTLGRETIEKLRRVQDLLRHAIPTGDLAVIFDRALTLLLADVERTKLAATDAPRKARALVPGSRHIPADVRRAVWARDEGRCAFIGPQGLRCTERGFLEFHHLVLWEGVRMSYKGDSVNFEKAKRQRKPSNPSYPPVSILQVLLRQVTDEPHQRHPE